jgi:hypothetical protein
VKSVLHMTLTLIWLPCHCGTPQPQVFRPDLRAIHSRSRAVEVSPLLDRYWWISSVFVAQGFHFVIYSLRFRKVKLIQNTELHSISSEPLQVLGYSCYYNKHVRIDFGTAIFQNIHSRQFYFLFTVHYGIKIHLTTNNCTIELKYHLKVTLHMFI